MATPHYCTLCGASILVLTHPIRNPHSPHHRRRMTGHDLCRRCYRDSMNQLMSEQRNGPR